MVASGLWPVTWLLRTEHLRRVVEARQLESPPCGPERKSGLAVVKGKRMKKRFTKTEHEIIDRMRRTVGDEEIAAKIGRTRISVRSYRHRNGLLLPPEVAKNVRRRGCDARREKTYRCPPGTQAEKVRASGLINMRLRRGAMTRPVKCDECGKGCRPDAHHDDYRMPDRVRWLCRSCHMKWHMGE